MAFYVGQKVVCVDDQWTRTNNRWLGRALNRPMKNGVYTIRAIRKYPSLGGDNALAFLLSELTNPVYVWGKPWGICEAGFKSVRFRPLVERKTDISVFTQMLIPSKVTEHV